MLMAYLVIKSVPYILVLMMGIFLPIMIFMTYRSFNAGMGLLFITFAINALTMQNMPFIHLGLQLYLEDIMLGFLLFVGILRLFFSGKFPALSPPWILFCATLCLSFALGILSYGSVAGVQARPYFYFASAAFYAMSFGLLPEQINKLFRNLVAISIFLMILVIVRWIITYLPVASMLPPGGAFNVDGKMRVIPSYEAVVLAQTLIMIIFFFYLSRSLQFAKLLLPLYLACVLALQHRSVWLATMAGFAASLFIAKSSKLSPVKQVIMLGLVVLFMLVPLSMTDKFSGVTDQLSRSAERAISGSDTTGERLNSWKALLDKWASGGVKTLLVGQSFGSDMTRYVGSTKITYQAHNMYVQTLMNTGIVGLTAYMLVLGYTIFGLWKISRNKDEAISSNAKALLVLMSIQMVYHIPYGVNYLQGFIFGLAIGYVKVYGADKKNKSQTQVLPVSVTP